MFQVSSHILKQCSCIYSRAFRARSRARLHENVAFGMERTKCNGRSRRRRRRWSGLQHRRLLWRLTYVRTLAGPFSACGKAPGRIPPTQRGGATHPRFSCMKPDEEPSENMANAERVREASTARAGASHLGAPLATMWKSMLESAAEICGGLHNLTMDKFAEW